MDDGQEYEPVFQMWENNGMGKRYPNMHSLRFKVTLGVEHTEYSKRGKRLGRSKSWELET